MRILLANMPIFIKTGRCLSVLIYSPTQVKALQENEIGNSILLTSLYRDSLLRGIVFADAGASFKKCADRTTVKFIRKLHS